VQRKDDRQTDMSQVAVWSMCVCSDDLEWPWKAGHERSIFFQADLLNNNRTVWSAKFGRITRVGEWCISMGQPHPQRKGAGTQRSPIMVSFHLCAHPLTQSYQIWRGTTYRGLVLGGKTHPFPRRRGPSAP